MTIYSSKFRCGSTVFMAVKALFQEIKVYRWQIWLTIKKKIKMTYEQDVFGLFWSIVMPIIPMTVYMVLAQIKVFKTVEDMPFVYYIGVGMLIWLLMATTIHTILRSIKTEKSILTTTTFPIFPMIVSRLGEVLHDTSIRFFALIVIVVWYQLDIAFLSIILALLSLIPAIIFALGIGMLLTVLDVIVQDTRRVVLLVLRYGLFMSSVIFPFPEEGVAGIVNSFNFFNTFINATRDLLFYGSMNHLDIYIYTSLVGIILFLFAAKFIYVMDFKIREYL